MKERKPIKLPGPQDGYLTKYFLPTTLKARLATACPPRGRSRWVAQAVSAFKDHDLEMRNLMLLADTRLRQGELEHVSVRLSTTTQQQMKAMLTDFRRQHPEEDLDISGVFRGAVLFHLRQQAGITIRDL